MAMDCIGNIMDDMTELNPTEASRIYTFPGGDRVTLTHVTHLLVRPSGSHRLKTADGRLHIVPAGWIHIELDTSAWTL
jgi:hypothetical protein